MVIEVRVKVTRHYQITIPSEIRNALGIREGDVLTMRLEDGKIVIEKCSDELPKIRLGRRLSVEEIEKIIEESVEEMMG